MTNTNGLTIAALGVSLVALAAGTMALLGSDQPAPAPPADLTPVLDRIASLEKRLVRVEKRPVTSARPRSASAPSDAVAEERLAALEKRIEVAEATAKQAAQKASEVPTAPSVADLVRHVRRGGAKGNKQELQQQAIDRSLDVGERLGALRALRGMRDGRSREVVLAMIDLARNTEHAAIRADIFRQLHRVTTPELEQPLIDAVRSDPDRTVREKAAEALDHYLDSPTVVATLRHAAEHDESAKVRRQAEESLEGGERKGR